jgi:hypothetical protein
MEASKRHLHLSTDEAAFLEEGEEGDALLVSGNARVGLHLDATEEEDAFAKT